MSVRGGGRVSCCPKRRAYSDFELRDGTLLTGDLIGVTELEVIVRARGNSQHIDRNKVKRILLTERTSVDAGTAKDQ